MVLTQLAEQLLLYDNPGSNPAKALFLLKNVILKENKKLAHKNIREKLITFLLPPCCVPTTYTHNKFVEIK